MVKPKKFQKNQLSACQQQTNKQTKSHVSLITEICIHYSQLSKGSSHGKTHYSTWTKSANLWTRKMRLSLRILFFFQVSNLL